MFYFGGWRLLLKLGRPSEDVGDKNTYIFIQKYEFYDVLKFYIFYHLISGYGSVRIRKNMYVLPQNDGSVSAMKPQMQIHNTGTGKYPVPYD